MRGAGFVRGDGGGATLRTRPAGAARQFQRSFVLAEGVDVGEAIMENGLLHVDLTRAVPESVVQTINIRKG